jgi:hypothetical protein
MLRAYTVSRYCYGEKEPGRVLLGSIPYGAGRIFVSTLAAGAEEPRLARLENLIVGNLTGKPVRETLLSRELAVQDESRSRGYPESVYWRNGMPAKDAFSAMLEMLVYRNERMNAKPLLAAGGFTALAGKDGRFTPERPGTAVLYYTVQSDTARKNRTSSLGIPDPTAQTFLDISGNGKVTAWLNGRALGELKDGGTFPDLELERGFNHLLLIWEPAEPQDGINMKWRNIMRRPETQLVFDPR